MCLAVYWYWLLRSRYGVNFFLLGHEFQTKLPPVPQPVIPHLIEGTDPETGESIDQMLPGAVSAAPLLLEPVVPVWVCSASCAYACVALQMAGWLLVGCVEPRRGVSTGEPPGERGAQRGGVADEDRPHGYAQCGGRATVRSPLCVEKSVAAPGQLCGPSRHRSGRGLQADTTMVPCCVNAGWRTSRRRRTRSAQ